MLYMTLLHKNSLIIMFPQNMDPVAHERLIRPANYTFDLKLNVDFNSGYVNLKLPNQPFNKK